MAIYPDKKDGKLTGRFRVELQREKERYRKRWDSYAEAQKDEERVKGLWASGELVGLSVVPEVDREVHSLTNVVEKAKGTLWAGTATEESCWAHIRNIGDALGRNTLLDDITPLSTDRIVKHLRKIGKADATINRHMAHLVRLLEWGFDRGYRTLPARALKWKGLKETSGRIRWITAEEEAELERLLPPVIWKVVKVAIETGCRRDELLTVEKGQINGSRLHLWKTKTNSPRTVPLGPKTLEMLTELVHGNQMPTRFELRAEWIKAKTAMGLKDDKEFTFHVTRHTRATRLLDAGVGIKVIKEYLGHKRLETTERYAHVKPDTLEVALQTAGAF